MMNDEREPQRVSDEGSDAPLSLRAALRSASRDVPAPSELAALASVLGPVLAHPAQSATVTSETRKGCFAFMLE